MRQRTRDAAAATRMSFMRTMNLLVTASLLFTASDATVSGRHEFILYIGIDPSQTM